MKKFEVGGKYSVSSICNSNCVWVFEVLSRTAKTVTLACNNGETMKCRINEKISTYRKAETVYPFGQYSMAPTLTAEN